MVITGAIANFTTPATILIEGQQFRSRGARDPNPLVFIGVPGGLFQPLEIQNATNTSILARLPVFTPGSHRLVVYRSHGRTKDKNDDESEDDFVFIDVTLGAAGP